MRKIRVNQHFLCFQITWAALALAGYMVHLIWAFDNFSYPSPSMLRNLAYGVAVIYFFDLAMVVFNAFKIASDKRVWYYPRINLL